MTNDNLIEMTKICIDILESFDMDVKPSYMERDIKGSAAVYGARFITFLLTSYKGEPTEGIKKLRKDHIEIVWHQI